MKKSQPKLDILKFKVLHDNVLVKGINISERDGIIKPDSYDDKPEIGEVISVGPDATVLPDDVVYFNKYSSTKFNVDGNDFFFVREEDIVAYIR